MEVWNGGATEKGPATRPFSSSMQRYWSITEGWSDAEGMPRLADFNDTARGLKPSSQTH